MKRTARLQDVGTRARRVAAAALALASVLLAPSSVLGATVRAGFAEQLVVSGLSNPTAMAFAPDGRLFVCQQGGQLRVIKDGVLLAQPFVQVTVSSAGERGLLGVAFDPNFPSDPYVYVYYTATSPTVHNRVSRFTASGDTAVPGSEVILLDLPALSGATNHNGGAIHFGPDGLLYIAVGENAAPNNSQSLATPLGKILRIARDGTIPPNPFDGQTTGINRAIWAMGLRNPFTFGIDPVSGRMLINDVGQNTWEEINEGLPGANYGWPETEGPTNDPRFTGPLHAYSHAATGGCAITGAAFYPSLPSAYPADFAGDYFFADLCAGWIRQLDVSGALVNADVASGIPQPVDLAIGPDGNLYYVARGTGGNTGFVARIEFVGGTGGAPSVRILQPSAALRYTAGTRIRFGGSATDREDGALPASAFTWQVVFHSSTGARLLGAPVTGVTRGSFVIPNTGDASPNVWYRIHLSATDSSGQTSSAHLDVRPAVARVRLGTSVPGTSLLVNGEPVRAPATLTTVLGMRLLVEAPAEQRANRSRYEFRSWSDGGARSHLFAVRSASSTLSAGYRRTGRDENAPAAAPPRSCTGEPCLLTPTGRTARPRP